MAVHAKSQLSIKFISCILRYLTEYAKKLTAAGVHNEVYLAKGAIHAFYTMPGGCLHDLCTIGILDEMTNQVQKIAQV